jgi:hypothetical protein
LDNHPEFHPPIFYSVQLMDITNILVIKTRELNEGGISLNDSDSDEKPEHVLFPAKRFILEVITGMRSEEVDHKEDLDTYL